MIFKLIQLMIARRNAEFHTLLINLKDEKQMYTFANEMFLIDFILSLL